MAEADDLEGLLDIPNLARFLDRELGGGPIDITVRRHTAGYSNLTLMVDRGDQRLVMRRPPGGNLLPSAHDVLREYRFLSAVYGKARVPRPLVACDDLAVIGAPFYVMERVEGQEIRDTVPTAYDTPEGRRRMSEDMVQALVEIHAVDWRAAGLTAPSGTIVDRQLGRWTKQWELTKARTRELPGLDAIADWLKANRPEERETTIHHGDYKIDNIFYSKSEPRVLAVLDWELATFGDPIADVGWMARTWGDREQAARDAAEGRDVVHAVTTREGFLTADEMAQLYAERSGRTLENLRYFQLLGMFKGAVIGEGIYMRYLEGNVTNPLAVRMRESVPLQIEAMQRLLAG